MSSSNEDCMQIADLCSLVPAVGAGVLTAKLGGSTGAILGATAGGCATGLAFCCFFSYSSCGTTSKSNPESTPLTEAAASNSGPSPQTMAP